MGRMFWRAMWQTRLLLGVVLSFVAVVGVGERLGWL